jgi:GAF domain-containing protein
MQMEQTNATHVNGAGSQAQARPQAAARPQSPTRAQAPADTFSPDYALLAAQVRSLAEEDAHWLPVLANASALVMESLPDLNWAGFYLMRGGRLVLGPFQGKVACVHIEVGRGVCGTAAELDETQLVANVHEFAGHIACDSTSNSEVVVPIHAAGKVVGVLDIDSPQFSRFSEEDRDGLEAFVRILESAEAIQ